MDKKKAKNIFYWLSDNKVLYGINLGDDLQDALKKIENRKHTLVGKNNYGYYYLENGYRFGFCDGVIDEIGIDLLQSKKYRWFINNNNFSLNLKKAKIHKVLNFLNDLFIKWYPIKSKDFNALIYRIDKFSIYLIFDVYSGNLEKITSSK